jgi:hypothetical protein
MEVHQFLQISFIFLLEKEKFMMIVYKPDLPTDF